jgi:hypothetical protein
MAPTAKAARDVMIDGLGGILSVSWKHDRDHRGNLVGRPVYEPSKARLTWENGAIATIFSAEEADRLRGPQHEVIWADELAAWDSPDDAWGPQSARDGLDDAAADPDHPGIAGDADLRGDTGNYLRQPRASRADVLGENPWQIGGDASRSSGA